MELRRHDPPASAESLRHVISLRHSPRLHCLLILSACFGVGLLVTFLLLKAGVASMWVRYAFALIAAYLTFLLGVRIWLHYAGFHRARDEGDPGLDFIPQPSEGGTHSGFSFHGGGGGSGGGGASGTFGESSSSESSFTDGFDLGDAGIVIVVLAVLALAVAGSVVWLIYAAPTILAEAAFAALLSAGLVRGTRRLANNGWMASVIGNTWLAFTVVFALAMAFALVAQHYFPEARTLSDVLRRM